MERLQSVSSDVLLVRRRLLPRAFWLTLFPLGFGLIALILSPPSPWRKHMSGAAAKSHVPELESACRSYFSAASRLPLPSGGTDFQVETTMGSRLLSVLAGRDPALSWKGTDYITRYVKSATPGKSGGWQNGLADVPPDLGLFDRWGNPYRVLVDGDGDGKVENPDPVDRARRRFLPWRFAIWSAGPDGNFTTWSDNVISW